MNAQQGRSYFHTISSLSALRGERWHRSTIHTWILNISQKYRNTNNNNNNNNNNNYYYYYYYYNDKNTINSNSNDNNDSNNKHRNEKGRV